LKEEVGMTPDDYIAQRLDAQIAWYDRKSVRSQRSYKSLRIIEVVVAASIPFMVGYITDVRPSVALVVGLAGVAVAGIGGLLEINQCQENWSAYGTTCESLQHHKYRLLAGADPCGGDDAFNSLVDNVESLTSKENTNWSEYIKSQSKEHTHG
jgi:hypothetical protein